MPLGKLTPDQTQRIGRIVARIKHTLFMAGRGNDLTLLASFERRLFEGRIKRAKNLLEFIAANPKMVIVDEQKFRDEVRRAIADLNGDNDKEFL